MAFNCSPLFLVFWRKNFLYLRYNSIALCLMFFVWTGVQWGYLHWTRNVVVNNVEVFETKDYEVLKASYFPGNEYDLVYYAPSTDNARTFIDLVRMELDIPIDRIREHKNGEEMQFNMEQECKDSCFAINILSLPDPGTGGKLKYSLSSNRMRISPEKAFVNDEEVNHQKSDDEYIREGFLTLQFVIDRQYMRYRNIVGKYDLLINSIPNLEVDSSDSYRLIHFGTLFGILFNILLLATFVVPFVEEKQNGLKEFLSLVTPQSFLNGQTFFLLRFGIYSVYLVLILCVACRYGALGLVGFGYMLVLYLLFIVANMAYAYLISVCFHSVFYAKIGGLILLTIPYAFGIVRSQLTNMAFYLFGINAFLEGLDVLQTFSNKHREFGGADLFRVIKDDSSCLFIVYVMLIFQTILYALLYNYFVNVFPGPGGLKRPFLFFLDPNTYKKIQPNEYTTSPRGTHAIIITNLCKKFVTSKREVNIADHLDMTINNKEITVLLGHNGAGKTTMMNMIMGIVPKDDGKIVVCSERDVASYRHLIGFCPQHCVFMGYMTCQQHLEFFEQLRGANRAEAKGMAIENLHKLHLDDKANEYGKNLSGGMKRRLALGIAISGNTKIIILDEPSSGLDVTSRRKVWDILLRLRKDKAILLTTHYMEEAEVLGDTICILANGKLQANGTPLKLKRELGCGYRLKLEAHETDFLERETLQTIWQFIPSAKLQSFIKPTVNIDLPYAYELNFHDMLRNLEGKMEELGIKTISITDTSLEAVFLNCAGEFDTVDTPDARASNEAPLLAIESEQKSRQPISTWKLWAAIFYKKLTFLTNEWRYSLFMLTLSLISVGCVIVIMYYLSLVTNEEVLPLNLSHLRSGIIYINNPTGQNQEVVDQMNQYIHKSGLTAKMFSLRGNNTVRDELLQMQSENLADFLQDTVGLIDMNVEGVGSRDTYEIYYASNRYHSSVILLNMINNCMLKLFSQEPGAHIDAIYAPLKRFVSDVSSAKLEYFVIIASTSSFFSMFYYIVLVFRENTNGFRQLQPMSRFTYWFATFTFDMLTHGLVCVILYTELRVIMPAELYNIEEQKLIVMSIFFYGVSYFPILYTLGNIFKSISTISTYLLLMLIISQITPLITSSNIHAMHLHSTKIVLLRFLPDFNLNHQLRVINENLIEGRRKSMKSLEDTGIFFLYAITVYILVMGFFTIVLEQKYYRQKLRNFLSNKSCKFPPKNINASCSATTLPNDCRIEQERVEQLLTNQSGRTVMDHPLIVKGLRKSYNDKLAVNGVSFAAERGECFGLLGVNGAGKTSTFQMITANLTMDSGHLQIEDKNILHDEVAYRQRFGYCPQYDALNKFMTAEQCLRFMALLRGLSWSCNTQNGVEASVRFWLQKMQLEKYRHVPVRNYSGGTKRKLLAAMAMIGEPPLILLDEPTTGVDPISRRFLWQCIKDFQMKDRTVVLTSHSMDECEELCNRLAIMANGKFQCVNNICALKRLSGYTITLKMKIDTETEENIALISNKLSQEINNLELRECHAGTLTYYVRTEEHVLWSRVFRISQEFLGNKLSDLVEYYSVNECTLEDIFLKFEREAKEISTVCEV